LGLSACNEKHAEKSPVELLGLSETVLGRPLVEDAMRAANAILGGRVPYRLTGSWESTAKDPTLTTVPVYLVDRASVPAVYAVMVPDACRCVFVQTDSFRAWLDTHTKSLEGAMLSIEPSSALTFMLLHEVGHIAHHDPGQFEAESGIRALNLDVTTQKEREAAADAFAAEQVEAAMQGGDGFLSAMSVSLAMSNLSWNLQAERQLNHFGGTVLCATALFADNGYTHPNMELRVLMANDLLSHSPLSHQLVEEFRSCRQTPPKPVLYKAE
jgi:hypothetical protein